MKKTRGESKTIHDPIECVSHRVLRWTKSSFAQKSNPRMRRRAFDWMLISKVRYILGYWWLWWVFSDYLRSVVLEYNEFQLIQYSWEFLRIPNYPDFLNCRANKNFQVQLLETYVYFDVVRSTFVNFSFHGKVNPKTYLGKSFILVSNHLFYWKDWGTNAATFCIMLTNFIYINQKHYWIRYRFCLSAAFEIFFNIFDISSMGNAASILEIVATFMFFTKSIRMI